MTKIDRHLLAMVPITILMLGLMLYFFFYSFPVWKMFASLPGFLAICLFSAVFFGAAYRVGYACYDWIRIHTGDLVYRDFLRVRLPNEQTYTVPPRCSSKYRLVVFFDNVGAKCIQGNVTVSSESESRIILEFEKYRSFRTSHKFFEAFRYSSKNMAINKTPFITDFAKPAVPEREISINLNIAWKLTGLEHDIDRIPNDEMADIEVLLLNIS